MTRATHKERGYETHSQVPHMWSKHFHLWLGRTRICIAPVPDGEAPSRWTGQLFLSLQKRKEERWLKRRG
jgi:hypothetical protein